VRQRTGRKLETTDSKAMNTKRTGTRNEHRSRLLLKTAFEMLKSTYVSVEPFHLFRYLDEEAFRFNERKNEDGDRGRFIEVLRQVVGRRLTYKQLIGDEGNTERPTSAPM
jgi:hypothetical protein